MATDRFPALLSAFTAAPSRRTALHALGGLGLAGLLRPTAAKKKHKRKKRENKQPCPVCPAPPPPSPPPPPVPFCAGKNHCATAAHCQVEGSRCYCWMRADTGHIGEPFCGGLFLDDVPRCDDCVSPAVCVILGGNCGGLFACVPPCPNPQ
jgi:hypothetical protein